MSKAEKVPDQAGSVKSRRRMTPWFLGGVVFILLMLIVAISRAGAALVQLLTPDWRIRPPV